MARKKEERSGAAYCRCNTIFEYEERDNFSGEIFCPSCMTRISGEERYKSVAAARKSHPAAALYKGS